MKALNFTLIIMTLLLISCSKSNNQPANAVGFEAIEKEIKSKFGADAYFTDLSISYNKSIGNIIGVTVTDNPESLKIEQWNQTQGTWKQISEITLRVPKGSKAADFMFQLNEKIKLSKLGELVEKAKEQLKIDKKLDNAALDMAFINFPKNGDISKAEYVVMLKLKKEGTLFTFSYKLNGKLIKQ